MKLRNKKTGEIKSTWNNLLTINFGDIPAEPLIKDEEVRKAVRAWAEALDLRWFKRCGPVNARTSRLYGQDAIGTGYTMELEPDDLYGTSISKKGYTLAELCGEEGE